MRFPAVLLLATLAVQQAQEEQILQRADKLLDEAKAAYEAAREKGAVAGFVDAGFKLEEARIKYFVLQEIGSAEKQKLAAERLRAVNQLSKLINDGKKAASGKTEEDPPPPPPKPADPAKPAEPAPPPLPPPPAEVDVMRRAPIPDAAKQKEAEKILKDLYKEQYSKKTPGERLLLARMLLQEARKSKDDLVSQWVLYREAQDLSVQIGEARLALAAIDDLARLFDIDPVPMKSAAIAAAGKVAKTPEEFGFLVDALDRLIDELLAADLYDAADKSAASSLQFARRTNDPKFVARATLRAKEVSEAKSRFQTMKAVLQTLARNPDDPAANLEMGQFLCLVKANWDLGVRFLVKGSDTGLKALAERELALGTHPADQAALADAWYDLAEKEKVPYRKTQILAHARVHYEGALPGAVGLARSKIEQRLEAIVTTVGAGVGERPQVNLLKLVDLKKDAVNGVWSRTPGGVTANKQMCARLQLPYVVPAEYDLTISAERSEYEILVIGVPAESTTFGFVIFPGERAGFDLLDGKSVRDQADTDTFAAPNFPQGKPVVIKISVRKNGVKASLDGKVILNREGGLNRLGPNRDWAIPNSRCPYLGSHYGNLTYSSAMLTPIADSGRLLR